MVRDLPLGLALVVASLIPALKNRGTQLGELPGRPFDLLTVLVLALEGLPLAVRRKWPLICLILVSAGFVVDQLHAYHLVAGSALPVALLSAGAYLERGRWATAGVLTVAYAGLAVALARQGAAEGLVGFITFYLACAFAWGIGAWLRQTRAVEEERRRNVAETTRTAERTRIARELHDVVTHHVTAMVVQVEAARYLTAAPDRLDQTLGNVAGTGRRAITDLRHLLDLLNPDHGPVATGALSTLVDQTRQAGQPVEFVEDGRPQESPGSAEAIAHRVVQEALTNALKYDHGGQTSVRVRHGARDIMVEIKTDGTGTAAASPGGSGRGLSGLRERVDVVGGEFRAGPDPAGGFVVTARIPAGSGS
ncbi:sensor histidine kinase [Actinoplanes sp. NPDC049265]|uniref:sensor histidine kinase n=1 Tax=Actinoplanes sp. NPDC049265 TaxID=3363902 RepID=UPI0037223694